MFDAACYRTPRSYTATRTVTARCAYGYEGDSVTKTATYTSCHSFAHAQQMARALALEAGQAELVCTRLPGIYGCPRPLP